MERMIKQRANEKSAKNNPFSLFQAQLQLRILCNHGTFQKSFSHNPVRDLELESEAIFATLGRDGDVKCSCCGEMVPMLSTICPVDEELACKHRICPECVPDWYTLDAGSSGDTSSLRRCPLCVAKHRCSRSATPNQQAASIPRPQNLSGLKPHFNMNGSSTKMRALLIDIKADITDAKRYGFDNASPLPLADYCAVSCSRVGHAL
jgi:SWI/SNF-related matrix-associated actin-dependent regulator of chromatin subfamily A3